MSSHLKRFPGEIVLLLELNRLYYSAFEAGILDGLVFTKNSNVRYPPYFQALPQALNIQQILASLELL
jgi:hypothetical protein